MILIILGLSLVLGCGHAEQRSETVAAEIIVKFAAQEEISDTIVKALNDSSAETTINDFVADLSRELGVPLTYSRLTSGREIIIAIPAERVIQEIVGRLENSDGVSDVVVERATQDDGPVNIGRILVTIAPSENDPGVDADALGARLVGAEDYPVACDRLPDNRLLIRPDFERLVATLVTRLAGRPGVEYAQPNYVVRHYNRPGHER